MKKVLLILGGVIVVLLIAGGLYLTVFKKALSTPVNPLLISTPTPSISQKIWEDPAGFKFTYPGEIKINNHPEDEENYANLGLTADGHPGSITILVKDTKYKTIGDWQKKEATSGAQVLDTELGGHPAKKVAVAANKLTTATIDGNALVLVEGTLADQKYWQEIYNNLLSSFEFIPLASEKKPTSAAPGPWQGAGGAGGVIEEEEEVVE